MNIAINELAGTAYSGRVPPAAPSGRSGTVATSRRVDQGKPMVEVQKIDHTTQEPVGPVIGIDQKDIEQARNDGKPVSIDGHELAG